MKLGDCSAVLVYTALICASLLSWGAQVGSKYASFAAGIVIGMASLKSILIGLEFMELKRSHAFLRVAFLGWAIVLGAALTGIFLIPK